MSGKHTAYGLLILDKSYPNAAIIQALPDLPKALFDYFCRMSRQIASLLMGLFFLASCSSSEPHPEPTSMSAENIAPHETGKKLFYAKCASCHMVNKDMSGPALKGVENRWPDRKKLYAFIRNSEEVIRSDRYARKLWLQWNQTRMLPHPDLTDADIDAILQYVRSTSR